MQKLFQNVIKHENMIATDSAKEYIINMSKNNISRMLHHIEKIKLANIPMTKANLNAICDGVNYSTLEIFTNLCYQKDYTRAIRYILQLYELGYSIIDIFYEYYNFVLLYKSFTNPIHLYKVIIIVCDCISNFYEYYEHEIELIFFTHKIIKTLQSNQP